MGKTKITIPIVAYDTVPEIYKLVDDLTNLNSKVNRVRSLDRQTLIVDDFSAPPEQELVLDEATILTILDNGGDIEDYLFAIKQPISSGSMEVPADVPSRGFIYPPGSIRTFTQWFSGNASVWINTVSNEFMYYNQPNPSDGLILKASEANIIRQIDTVNYSFLTIAEVQALIVDTDWVKL